MLLNYEIVVHIKVPHKDLEDAEGIMEQLHQRFGQAAKKRTRTKTNAISTRFVEAFSDYDAGRDDADDVDDDTALRLS